MRKSLRKHRNVYVPSVFLRYCTRQILVIEWIDGVLMSDYIKLLQTDPSKVEAWRRCNDVDPNEVAESLFMTVQRQIHEDNLFHGDLHPGNILLLRDNCIALIDFGSVGTLEKGVRRRLTLYNRLINQGELTRGMAALLALSSPLPSTDLDMLIRKLVRSYQLLTKVTSSPAFSPEERAKSKLATQQARIMREYMVPVCWDFLRISRTGAALDASLRALNSEVDYYRLWRSYLQRRDARERLQRRKNFGEDVWQLFANSRDFNGRRLDDMIARQDVRTMVPMRSPRLLSQICVKLQGAFPFLVLLLLGAFLRQRHSTILPGMVNEFLQRTTDWIPVMSYGMWLLLGVVLVYCHFALKGLANHLRNS
jgi:ubiquinone biosynthesis protein